MPAGKKNLAEKSCSEKLMSDFVQYSVYVKVKVKSSLCLTNQALRHEGVWGSGYIIIIIMALQPFVGPWPLFKFLDPIHTRGSPRRKASAYTQNNTSTE
jgi:hypothetical protein